MLSRLARRAVRLLRPRPTQDAAAGAQSLPPGDGTTRFPGVPRMRFAGLDAHNTALLAAGADVRPPGELPRIHEFRDLLAVPGRAGLYTRAGEPVRESCHLFIAGDIVLPAGLAAKYERQRQRHSSPQAEAIERLLRKAEIVEESALFLGSFDGHYGHFLTDRTARFWAHYTQPRELKRVAHPMARAQDAGTLPHVAAVCASVGLAGGDLGTPVRPILYRHVLVPEPAFQNGHRIFPVADRVHVATAERLMPPGAAFGRPVYLSRRRLAGGIHDVADEAAVEALFEARGFTVLHPETMDLAGQIALFNSAPLIAGMAGSAFHTGMFALPAWRGTLLVLAGDEMINTRLVLQTAIKSYEAIYLAAGRFTGRGEDRRAVLTPDVPAIAAHLKALGI
jgi:hypothetical protein